MNPRLTRNELLRRGAAGGALLAFPSILAACGGGDSGGSTAGGELKDVLNFANWPLYIDEEKPTTLQDFTKQTRHQGQLLPGDQRQRRVLREGAGPALAGRRHRPRHLRLHGQLALPGDPRQRGLGAEARQGAHPEHREPRRRAVEPAVRPEPRVLAAVAVGDDRDRMERGAHGPDRDHRAALRGPEAQGQGLDADGARGLGRTRDARERRRSGSGNRRQLQRRNRARAGGRRLRPGHPLHGQRLRPAAHERDICCVRGVVGRRRPASRGQPEAQVGDPEGRRDDLDGQHAHPDGRERSDRLDVHELRVRPGCRCADRRVRQLRDAGEGCQGGAREDRPGDGVEHADLPGRGDARAGQAVRQRRARERGVHHPLAGSPRAVSWGPDAHVPPSSVGGVAASLPPGRRSGLRRSIEPLHASSDLGDRWVASFTVIHG